MISYCIRLVLCSILSSLTIGAPTPSPKTIIEPPHCSQTSIITSQLSSSSSSAIDIHRLMRLALSLNSTVCFRLNSTTSTSSLHTLTLTAVDQYHPIIETYRFAIPRIRTDCICECDIASTKRCDPQQYSYTQCDKSSLCYRSYYGSQPATGCVSHEHPAKLCCDIAFEPAHKSESYLAVRIDQPDAFARFVYRSYVWDGASGGRWSIEATKMVRMPVDGLTHSDQLTDVDNRRLHLSLVGGRPIVRQLASGMYFAKDDGKFNLKRMLPLNEIDESSLDKLGWFRVENDGRYTIANGQLKIARANHVKVIDCVAQKYQSLFDAKYFADGDDEELLAKLDEPIEKTIHWIKSARVDPLGRQVIVAHEIMNTDLELMLSISGGADDDTSFAFVHNSSKIGDFDGSIIVDQRSNRYLNVTMRDASGLLVGRFYRSASSNQDDEELVFTAYINRISPTNETVIIPLPASIDNDRYICISADDNARKCHQIEFYSTPLHMDTSRYEWFTRIGDCDDCNRLTIKGFLRNLNPIQWLDGVDSFSDAIMIATDVGVYFLVLLFLFLFLTKCLCPLYQCFVCCYGCCGSGWLPIHPAVPSKMATKY